MTLYFKGQKGLRKIFEDKHISDNTAVHNTAFAEIQKFCDERNFKIYYSRLWNTDLNGKQMTKIDVGSHSEFFYIYPALNLMQLMEEDK